MQIHGSKKSENFTKDDKRQKSKKTKQDGRIPAKCGELLTNLFNVDRALTRCIEFVRDNINKMG
jgi:hypothetical protein